MSDKKAAYIKGLKPGLIQLDAAASIEEIARRIGERLNGTEAQQPYVIGLYGEWGAGKTFWLESIQHRVVDAAENSVVVIPVFFNAWRFEKEPHLVIPLLKMTSHEVRRWSEFDPELKEGLEKISLGVAAAAAALTVNLGQLAEKALTGTQIIKTIKDTFENDNFALADSVSGLDEVESFVGGLNSVYLDFHNQLEKLLALEVGGQQLRLLFLIDDLDRCLPEKAVEMLESIKLFLDVKGTAFVLAVDDEVVERGVMHRYQSYVTKGEAHLPITGHEYLEKIIHLPVRIDRPNAAQVENFIQTCGDLKVLWDETGETISSDAKIEDDLRQEKSTLAGRREELNKLLTAIPSVPRKLRRLSESYGLRRKVLTDAHGPEVDPLVLLRVVALELFAPEIYRLAAKKGKGVLGYLKEWQDFSRSKPEGEEKPPGVEDPKPESEAQSPSVDDPEPEAPSDAQTKDFRRFWPDYDGMLQAAENDKDGLPEHQMRTRNSFDIPLLKALKSLSAQRAGFDPADLLEAWPTSSIKWAPYFRVGRDEQHIHNHVPAEFRVKYDVNADLERGVMDLLLQNVLIDSETRWNELRDKVPLRPLSKNDSRELYTELQNAKRAIGPPRKWLMANGHYFQRTDLEAVIRRLVDAPHSEVKFLETKLVGEEAPQDRLFAGDLLGWLGDHRDGVGLNKQGLPEIKWVEFKAGDYSVGSKADRENPPQVVTLEYFELATYPLTNQQFNAFVVAGGYEADQWWHDLKKPRYENSLWPHPNRPRTNVDWYEATAFCRWLSEELDTKIVLPDEYQWEAAARHPNGFQYPWGNEWQKGGGNVDEESSSIGPNYLEQTSTVGMYPKAKSETGLCDTAGNVWEWCENTYRPEEDKQPEAVRVLRGGSWYYGPVGARASYRSYDPPRDRSGFRGFRLCRLPSTDH